MSPVMRTKNLRVGMVIQSDVTSTYGGVLLNAGEVIDQKKLEKLQLHNIKTVKVIQEYGVPEILQMMEISKRQIQPEVIARFTESYQQTSRKVENIFNKVLSEGINGSSEQDLTDLVMVTQDLLNTVEHPENILKYFVKMKEVLPSIYSHSINVSILCSLFAKMLNYPEQKQQEVTLVGLLHDIGKVELNLDIQYNTTNLETLESDILSTYKKHAVLGYRILQESGFPEDVCLGVLMHHETTKGNGFPTKAKWKQIHEYAKILAIANYYDYLTFSAEAQKDVNPFAAIKILNTVKYDRFDLNIVATFLARIVAMYQNDWVELSTGEIGEIIYINQTDLTHPIVRIGNVVVDLSQEPHNEICKVF